MTRTDSSPQLFFCLSDSADGHQSLLRTLCVVVFRGGRSLADPGGRTWFLPPGPAAHPPPTEPEVLAAHLTGERTKVKVNLESFS